ncbi:15218_t:CDS:2, partial [Acaulospora colombiana]
MAQTDSEITNSRTVLGAPLRRPIWTAPGCFCYEGRENVPPVRMCDYERIFEGHRQASEELLGSYNTILREWESEKRSLETILKELSTEYKNLERKELDKTAQICSLKRELHWYREIKINVAYVSTSSQIHECELMSKIKEPNSDTPHNSSLEIVFEGVTAMKQKKKIEISLWIRILLDVEDHQDPFLVTAYWP